MIRSENATIKEKITKIEKDISSLELTISKKLKSEIELVWLINGKIESKVKKECLK